MEGVAEESTESCSPTEAAPAGRPSTNLAVRQRRRTPPTEPLAMLLPLLRSTSPISPGTIARPIVANRILPSTPDSSPYPL